MQIVTGYDVIHSNIHTIPQGLAVGYTTGSPDIAWTKADWDAHPDALRIDQDANASDGTADYLDVERGAALISECANWFRKAKHSFNTNARPGQRHPAVYLSAGNVTALANALINAGVTHGVGLVVANWDLTKAEAVADVMAAAGPFPIVGVQFQSLATYDINVFDSTWVHDRSGVKPPQQAGPFRHLTHTGDTIESIATERNESPRALLEHSAKHYTNGDLSVLSSVRLRPGVPYYTVNP
jgi:hypothetical protein